MDASVFEAVVVAYLLVGLGVFLSSWAHVREDRFDLTLVFAHLMLIALLWPVVLYCEWTK